MAIEHTPDLLAELIAAGEPTAAAISAPLRRPLSYDALRALVARTGTALASHGIGAGDRVAIVLPNGPAMASCFVAVAAHAAAAPLNPAYRTQEFDFYIRDLRATALIVAAGAETPAREVARRHGAGVVELHEDHDAAAGDFRLEFGDAAGRSGARPATADDAALLLHTSGTTSRPKIVPLSQRNLCASARHVADTLALTAADHCLNVMPLFHIHGLVAAVLATLACGARVSCTDGFDALRFFGWLETLAPSWYTAVPTMHQAILARAQRNAAVLGRARLRFIRSSSSSLPPQVMRDLEAAFRCPVIESYGMTEAAHQMASNPLPPAPRVPGSVGLPAGPEIRVADPGGAFLPHGSEGEIVIRGANVTRGYENNPQANAEAFLPDPAGGERWFRTGDLGVFDADGYLRISGRLKEIINRGGEKIAPREVDEVLMDHAAVAQVVTFSMPHPKLGEEVAAAVIVRPGMRVSEQELRDHVRSRLADFKVPRRILFVEEIPKGATGKLQRIGLAQRLGLAE
jgi:acyl-CoA synthetase (AMP-forming)/AMP-acid ligase II